VLDKLLLTLEKLYQITLGDRHVRGVLAILACSLSTAGLGISMFSSRPVVSGAVGVFLIGASAVATILVSLYQVLDRPFGSHLFPRLSGLGFIKPDTFSRVMQRFGSPGAKKAVSDYVTEQFLSRKKLQTVLGGQVLIVLGGIAAVLFGSAGIVFMAAGVLVLVHYALTAFRIKHGFFGGNYDEALELIDFITSEQKKGRKPPGSKLSRDYSVEGKSAVFEGALAAKGA
jgi:hypothetical protein